jgi:cardiolipin synthase A/B
MKPFSRMDFGEKDFGDSSQSYTRLVRSGYEYFELLEQLIHSAQERIHLQVYIYEEDQTGRQIAHALIDAAKRGVKVFVVADGYASQELSNSFIRKFKLTGIQFRYFNPLLKSKYFYFGRRMHHKVIVVDGCKAMVGGINISNNYNDTIETSAWLDWALYVEGEVASKLEIVCEDLRKFEVLEVTRTHLRRRKLVLPDQQVGIRINDWVRGRKDITASYLKMLRNATSRVTIVSSYLLPGKLLRRNLRVAAKRGIKIRLVMAGMSDVVVAKYSERYMYRWLLRNKIEIYEYKKNILHGKMAVCDGQWLTLGSYNVNNISAYASIELNLDVHNSEFAKQAEQKIEMIIQNDCKKITEEEYRSQDTLWNQFLQRSAYDIFRLLLFLFTFYFKPRE